MQARIRYYTTSRLPQDELMRSGRHMVATLGLVPGFVSFVMLDLGEGRLASVCICDEPAALDAADSVAASWLAEVAELRDEARSGEIVLQRGL
jgi:hypothetical protein